MYAFGGVKKEPEECQGEQKLDLDITYLYSSTYLYTGSASS